MTVKTLYSSPDSGFGQTIIYEDTAYPDSVIIVKTNGKGQEAKDMLITKEAIFTAARQLVILSL